MGRVRALSIVFFAVVGLAALAGGTALAMGGDTTIEVVDAGGDNGAGIVASIDAQGLPILAYMSSDFLGGAEVRVARCGDLQCSSTTTAIMDNIGGGAAIALDPAGHAVVAERGLFADAPFDAVQPIRVSRCQDPSCTTVTTNDIETATRIRGIALALDSASNPVVAYSLFDTGELRLVRCGDINCTSSTVQTLATQTRLPAVAVDQNDLAVVSFLNESTLEMQVAKCAELSCESTTIETIGTVSQDPRAGRGGSSIAVRSDNNPIVTFGGALGDDLSIVTCADNQCGTSQTTTVPASVVVGSGLTLDANEHAVVSFRDRDGMISLARCGDANCSSVDVEAIAPNGARESAVVVDGADIPSIAVYNSDLSLIHI